MIVAYYPGCSLEGIAREYDRSARLVCDRLDILLQEVRDWNCCGATAAHSLDRDLTRGLSARNLDIVKRMKLDRVTTPCAGCFSRLKGAARELKSEKEMPEVMHLLQLLVENAGLETIAGQVKRPLKGLRLAAYYGCLITRPHCLTEFDDPEQPQSMDRLLQALGAETVTWSHKTECCGGAFSASETGIVVDLGGQILEAARQGGAEAIAVACPMCQINLDSRRQAIEGDRGTRYTMPIFYFTQLMGLAYGYSIRRMGLKRMLTSPLPLLKKKGI
jgi:heterodisulfide reductase subunit B